MTEFRLSPIRLVSNLRSKPKLCYARPRLSINDSSCAEMNGEKQRSTGRFRGVEVRKFNSSSRLSRTTSSDADEVTEALRTPDADAADALLASPRAAAVVRVSARP